MTLPTDPWIQFKSSAYKQLIKNKFWQDGNDADGTNVISYSPQSERDYGSLICWARNEIGEQREPCVYRIFLGVRPDPPSNCSVLNQTAEAVEVWCRPGFDGGHPQQFQFEIFDTQSAVLLYNKSGRYPHLRVGNLESGVKLFIQVSAFNQRGRSALVPLEAYTVKIADKQTGKLFSRRLLSGWVDQAQTWQSKV